MPTLHAVRPAVQDRLTGKRVTVIGLARQGRALAHFLSSIGAHVTVTDRQQPESLLEEVTEFAGQPIRFVLGGHPVDDLLPGCDLLCLSGGVSPDIPLVREAKRRGIPLANDALLTLERSPVPVIGITGSSGKTTTATLVGEMLKMADVPAWVGGNIGTPLLDRLKDMPVGGWLVMELSSFQTELFNSSPHVGAVLNVTPNHLDRHRTMESYASAKERLLRFQGSGDVAVLGLDSPTTRDLLDEPWVRARRLAFSVQQTVEEGAFLRPDGSLILCMDDGQEEICHRSEVRLRGLHNVANLLAACCLAAIAGVPVEAMRQVGVEFAGVEHRLEWVRSWRGGEWYNDSIATSPERVVAALRSFSEPIVLLVGGRDKHLPWAEFATVARERVRHLVLFGEAASLIASTFDGDCNPPIHRCKTLEEAVHRAEVLMTAGDVVLLSPGGTSFDAFRDFAERGECYKALVRSLSV